jgi:hypothetical protein
MDEMEYNEFGLAARRPFQGVGENPERLRYDLLEGSANATNATRVEAPQLRNGRLNPLRYALGCELSSAMHRMMLSNSVDAYSDHRTCFTLAAVLPRR